MSDEKKLDYDAPFLLEAIFRDPPKRTPHDEEEEENPDALEFGPERMEEIAALWHDIIGLRSYPYPDEEYWDVHKGPKFIVVLREQGSFVVKGDFKHMFRLWKAFTKEYYGKNSEN